MDRPQRVRPVLLLFGLITRLAPGLRPRLQKRLVKLGYQLISRWDVDAVMTFMNYGYAPLDGAEPGFALSAEDEERRYCIQLYHRVAGAVDLTGKDVLEVGCGRGGGVSAVMRYLQPRTIVGIDFAERAIAFCRRRHHIQGLLFGVGDAELLPLKAGSFDAVVNVESSHAYPSVERFLREAVRVLRPRGYLLFADVRPVGGVDRLRAQLAASGLDMFQEERITPNVVRALDLDAERRLDLMRRHAPRMFRSASYEFAGVKGTAVYEALRRGDMEYVRFVLRKPGPPAVDCG